MRGGEIQVNERIKIIRKKLDLTQQEFADKLGIARNNIAGYETCKRSPSDAVVSLICAKCNVNEAWLRTGEGEMFEQLTDQQKLMKYTAMLLKDKDSVMATAIKNFIITYEQLDDTSKKVLEDVAIKYLENMKKGQ
ncbi:helix-turn-helix domain-containing protein [Bacteroides acidifaciens]|nr:helix-turn-helix transcriptional regulator [Bacteroides acidifaciens]